MTDVLAEKYIVRADYYGNVVSNKKMFFWFPRNKGNIIIDKKIFSYTPFGNQDAGFQIPLQKIIKVKLETLRPGRNRWVSGAAGSPYYILFWIPFWNRYILNLTILDKHGYPWEHFFKLMTSHISIETFSIIKNAVIK